MCFAQKHVREGTPLQENPHSRLVNDILVEASRLPKCRVWKCQVGMAEMKGKQVRYGNPGMPDIMGVIQGQAIGIEVKTGGAKLSADQKNFHAMFVQCGGKIFVARDVPSVLAWLHGLGSHL